MNEKELLQGECFGRRFDILIVLFASDKNVQKIII